MGLVSIRRVAINSKATPINDSYDFPWPQLTTACLNYVWEYFEGPGSVTFSCNRGLARHSCIACHSHVCTIFSLLAGRILHACFGLYAHVRIRQLMYTCACISLLLSTTLLNDMCLHASNKVAIATECLYTN